MSVFKDLDARLENPPFDAEAYRQRLDACVQVAQRVALVHVTGRERPLLQTVEQSPHEIPTSDDHGYYTDFTRDAERLLGLGASSYFYAGRACPDFGSAALAFDGACEAGHTGSATPFDTGGLVHPKRYIRVKLEPDTDDQRAAYGRSSVIALEDWRAIFGQVLAAYFSSPREYWVGRPTWHDPEELYSRNSSWRAWTFEVRFHEALSIHERVAWCADTATMDALRRRQMAQEPTAPGNLPTSLDRFLQEGPPPLEPRGTPAFCERLEAWIRREVGL